MQRILYMKITTFYATKTLILFVFKNNNKQNKIKINKVIFCIFINNFNDVFFLLNSGRLHMNILLHH